MSACTNAMSTDTIDQTRANCSNVDQTIATLEKEKADNDQRVANGVGQILPVSAIARLVNGEYETDTQITTGEWGQHLDAKLAELNGLKASCATKH